MTSGIYQLSFKDGSSYVGQSKNIQNRWQQHLDKLTKGTGASAVQDAFNNSGYTFNAAVLAECHPDYLDILEAYYIDTINPKLNTSRPVNVITGDITNILGYLNVPILDHIRNLDNNKNLLGRSMFKLQELVDACEELTEHRSDEELERDISNRIKDLTEELEDRDFKYSLLVDKHEATQRELNYLKQPWWKRWFS